MWVNSCMKTAVASVSLRPFARQMDGRDMTKNMSPFGMREANDTRLAGSDSPFGARMVPVCGARCTTNCCPAPPNDALPLCGVAGSNVYLQSVSKKTRVGKRIAGAWSARLLSRCQPSSAVAIQALSREGNSHVARVDV